MPREPTEIGTFGKEQKSGASAREPGEQQNCHELFRNKTKLAPATSTLFWPARSRGWSHVQLWLRVIVAKLSHIVCKLQTKRVKVGKRNVEYYIHLATIGIENTVKQQQNTDNYYKFYCHI